MDAVLGAGEHVPLGGDPEPVRQPGRHLREQAGVVEGPAADHVEAHDVVVPRAVLSEGSRRVAHVEQRLVGGEGEAVGLLDHVGDRDETAVGRIESEHVAMAHLTVCFVTLPVAGDPVGRIAEPDGAVGLHDEIVGGVEAPTLIAVDDGDNRSVMLGALDPPVAVRARDQATLEVERVAVGELDARAIHREAARGRPAHDAVVGDVAAQHYL